MNALLEAVRPGPAVTIQDLGRSGYGRIGISEGGAVDEQAHRLEPHSCATNPRWHPLRWRRTAERFAWETSQRWWQ